MEKIKRSQPIRITECLTCPKSVESNMYRRDCDRLQPVRIQQLMSPDREKERIRKSSARKKILPERLGQLSNKKHVSTKKQHNGQCIHDDTKHNHVRRNLNFNNMRLGSKKNEKNSTNDLAKSTVSSSSQTCNEVSEPMTRKSFLSQPNTIKNKYLQTCTNEKYKYSKIPEVSNENITNCNTSEVSVHFTKSENEKLCSKHNNNNSTESESKITSKECKPTENAKCSSLNIINTNFIRSCEILNTKPLQDSQYITSQQSVSNKNSLYVQNNTLHEVCFSEQGNLRYKRSEISKDQNKCIEDLCNNLQNTNVTMLENNLNVRQTSSQMIYVDKKEIMHLKCELEDLVNTTEENLSKGKSILTYLTRLLSISDEAVSKSGTFREKEEYTKSVLDKEVQVETCCKLIQPIDESLRLHHKYNQKRSLKEYMALKSDMTFLETPDNGKFKSLYKKNGIDNSVLSRTNISNKILSDLHTLYSDSPESN